MKEALALVDPDGNILAWSAGATALLGHAESDTQGRSLHSLLDGAGDDTASQSLTAALATETPSPFSAELRRDDGSAQLLELEVNRIAGPSGKLLAHLVQMSGPSQVEADSAAQEEAEQRAKDASGAAEEAKTALASALEEAEAAAEEAKESLAASEKQTDDAGTALAAAETRLDLAEEAAGALRTELEEHQSRWDVERAELVRSHVADRDALVESRAEERAAFIKRMESERAELEEQVRNDILAAEERAEGQLESQEQDHKAARAEWDDAMAIAGHETASRMSAITEKISQILIEGSDPAGNLPSTAISALARLIGRPELVLVDREEAASGGFDLSADDLILDDDGEDAIDAPPPVSPAMVATASELEAHVPGGGDEGESELDLDPSSELDLEPVSDLDPGSELELEPISELDVAPIPGLDEVDIEDEDDDLDLELDDEEGGDDEVGRDLAQEPTEEDLASDSESKSEPNSGDSN
jgi:PAS domain S-box-containing protein